MWYSNRVVVRTHAKNGSRMAWAVIGGLGGWHRILPASPDGVTNVLTILSVALANSRRVDVYIKAGNIEQATLR